MRQLPALIPRQNSWYRRELKSSLPAEPLLSSHTASLRYRKPTGFLLSTKAVLKSRALLQNSWQRRVHITDYIWHNLAHNNTGTGIHQSLFHFRIFLQQKIRMGQVTNYIASAGNIRYNYSIEICVESVTDFYPFPLYTITFSEWNTLWETIKNLPLHADGEEEYYVFYGCWFFCSFFLLSALR